MGLLTLTGVFCVLIVLIVVFSRWYIQFIYKMLYVKPKRQVEELLLRDDVPTSWEKYGKSKQERKLKKLMKFVKQDRMLGNPDRAEQLESLQDILDSITDVKRR